LYAIREQLVLRPRLIGEDWGWQGRHAAVDLFRIWTRVRISLGFQLVDTWSFYMVRVKVKAWFDDKGPVTFADPRT
jgi:hypothetical protein